MEAYQWFLLGMMAAWTPAMVVVAILLARSSYDPSGPRRSSQTIARPGPDRS